MTKEVKEILTEWIYELYKAKGFDNVTGCNPIDFNIWEAKFKEQWDILDEQIHYLDSKLITDYEKEIEAIEQCSSNLAKENLKLKEILANVRKVVNIAWN